MRSIPTTGSRLAAVWLALASAYVLAGEPTAMKVHVDQPGTKISPVLYGIFFEEINRAGDGGIYAEMIQNRSFEDDCGGKVKSATATVLTSAEIAECQAVSGLHFSPNRL